MGAVRTFLDCFRTFVRIILIIVNVFVTLLGFLVLAVGIWSEATGRGYFELSDATRSFAHIPVLIIVVGIFILLLGIVGIIGGALANTIGGRIILGLYGFILSLLVVIEIAGGIAAGVEKDNLAGYFNDSLNSTFARYNNSDYPSYTDTWNTIQQTLQCCGTYGYSSYKDILKFDNVPKSCCMDTSNCPSRSFPNPTGIYTQGCAPKIQDFMIHNLGVIAGVAITFGFLQIIGVVASCFVAIAGRESEGKYQVV